MKGRLVYYGGTVYYQYPSSNIWHLARVQATFKRKDLIFINCRAYRIHRILQTSEVPWEYIEDQPERTCRLCDPLGIYERIEK